MVSTSNRTRIASTTASILAVLAIGGLLLPAASATGYLVNADTGLVTVQHGSNVFGGAGDTVDVGYGNHQCSDEDDVVDVGIQNREGDQACRWNSDQGCQTDEDNHTRIAVHPLGIDHTFEQDTIPPEIVPYFIGTDDERRSHCSDDGDTVDVGVANDEGGYGEHGSFEECYWMYQQGADEEFEGGDERDAVDVGVLNRECADGGDAVDAGILNCEVLDESDGIDLGVGNLELEDSDDTFDLSLLSVELNDGPDGNGANLFPGGFGGEFCYVHLPGPLR